MKNVDNYARNQVGTEENVYYLPGVVQGGDSTNAAQHLTKARECASNYDGRGMMTALNLAQWCAEKDGEDIRPQAGKVREAFIQEYAIRNARDYYFN